MAALTLIGAVIMLASLLRDQCLCKAAIVAERSSEAAHYHAGRVTQYRATACLRSRDLVMSAA